MRVSAGFRCAALRPPGSLVAGLPLVRMVPGCSVLIPRIQFSVAFDSVRLARDSGGAFYRVKRLGRTWPAGPVMVWVNAAALRGGSGPT